MSLIPEKIGDYTVLCPLKPNMRTPVFAASDASGEKVAIKISSRISIQKEYHLMNQFNHPYILKPIDLFQVGSKNVLVTPLAKQDLALYIVDNFPLPEKTKTKIMFSLLTAINELHKLGVWHRDIKPQNIFVFPDPDIPTEETFVLADLEFAGCFEGQRPRFIQGTKNFYAPEILLDTSYCNKIDCWAAGAVMYTIYTGKHPFNDIYYQYVGDIFFEDKIPALAEDLIRHLLCVDQNKRYSAEQALNHEYFRKQETNTICRMTNDIQGYFEKNPIGSDDDTEF